MIFRPNIYYIVLRRGIVGLLVFLMGTGVTLPRCVFASDQVVQKKHPTGKKKDPDPEPSHTYPPLVIGPGDLLVISVLGFDRNIGGAISTIASSGSAGSSSSGLPSNFLVDADGQIFFPFVGAVNLKGLSQVDASRLLMKKLKPFLKFPQVTVVIQSSNTYNVSVLGDVVHPGQFMIRGKPDIISMLAQAGGPGENPDLGGALLTHGEQKIHIDLGKYLSDQNYHGVAPTVYPGDVLYVPKSGWPTLGEIAIFAGIIYSATIAANALSKR